MIVRNPHPLRRRGLPRPLPFRLAPPIAVLFAFLLVSCGRDEGIYTTIDDHDDHDVATGACGHADAQGYILEQHGSLLVQSWQGFQEGEIEVIEGIRIEHVQFLFLDPDSVRYALADTCPENALTWTIGQPGIVEIERDPGLIWYFHVRGIAEGTTTLSLTIWHDGRVHIQTDPIPIRVVPDTRPRYAISGRVRLVGRLADETGQETGLRVVEDADGVEVLLAGADSSSQAATTAGGLYRFEGLLPTAYKARTRSTPETWLETHYILVLTGDAFAADTLVVAPQGDLRTFPNPFPYEHGEAIEFTTTTAEPHRIEIYDLGWRMVWSYEAQAPPGFVHVHWPGWDDNNEHVPPGAYWIVLRRDGTVHTSLVFKEAP